jgi:hypothetical protein
LDEHEKDAAWKINVRRGSRGWEGYKNKLAYLRTKMRTNGF